MNDLESLKKTQRELSELIGVSGHEEMVVEYIQSKIDGLVDKMWVDPLGSLLAVKDGKNPKERILKIRSDRRLGYSHIAWSSCQNSW